MPFKREYTPESIGPEQVAQSRGPLVIEFGTNWCGVCKAAQPTIQSAMERHSGVEHAKVEDGKGRRLGRTFGVKLWPTMIFLRDGQEITRLVRPRNQEDIESALARIVEGDG